jgi:hypothetical protein
MSRHPARAGKVVSLVVAIAALSASALPGLPTTPAVGAAAPQPVACSAAALIIAINNADAGTGSRSLTLAKGCIYKLTKVNNYWYGPTGLPPISTSIAIQGNAATIERNVSTGLPPFRFFFVGANPNSAATLNWSTPGPGSLTLTDLSLVGGEALGGNGSGGGLGAGGAIYSQGSVTLHNVTMTSNRAIGGNGGPYVGGSPDIGFTGGGGIGSNASTNQGGGFGGSVAPINGKSSTNNTSGMGGGGGGFVATESSSTANGGGPQTGTGGNAGTNATNAPSGLSGDGSGGAGPAVAAGTLGGGFGVGGKGGTEGDVAHPTGGAGGGVGGGGGAGDGGGGGGFGGGGGQGGGTHGGDGGFGGGGGAAVGAIGGFGGGKGDLSGDGGGGGGAGMGGAIFDQEGSLTITNSTLTGNVAAHGIGIKSDANGYGYGGAIFVLGGGADPTHKVSISDSTLGSNFADRAALYVLAYNGARADNANVTLVDDILSGTITSQGTAKSVADLVVAAPATLTSGQSNDSTARVTATTPNLIHNSVVLRGATLTGKPLTGNPQLRLLGANGGPGMETMALGSTSKALKAGRQCIATDERGVLRSTPKCDLGAFERTTPALPKITNIFFSRAVVHHPSVAFTVRHGLLAYDLKQIVLVMPAGVRFAAGKGMLAKYLTVQTQASGKRVPYTVKVTKTRRITITLTHPEIHVRITVITPEMTFGPALTKHLQQHPETMRLGRVHITDVHNQHATVSLKLTPR